MSTLYDYLATTKGKAYNPDKIKPYSWLVKEPDVKKQPNEIAGNSRIWGDISPTNQAKVIDLIIEISTRYKLSYREIAYVLLMARVESGFNPDAAAGTTTAAGIGQYTVDTVSESTKPIYSKHYLGFNIDLSGMNIFDAERGAFGILLSYFICRTRALTDYPKEVERHLYIYHHEGWYTQPKGKEDSEKIKSVFAIIQTEILPRLDETERLLKNKTNVQFTLKTADNKPYPNQPFTMVVSKNGAGGTAEASVEKPCAAQHDQDVKVTVGATDSAGKTPLIEVDGLSEVVFSILNINYKSILVNYPGRGANQLTDYKIRRGDTLGKIAKEHNTTIDAIVKINAISNPNKVGVGQVLRIPCEEGESIPSIWMRRPSSDWLASVIGPHIGAEGIEDTAAVVEHTRSHVALPSGNKAHDESVEHNNISIAGGKQQNQLEASTTKKVEHKTNEPGVAQPVQTSAKPNTELKVISNLLYPLPKPASADYKSGARRFGAPRGGRRHAGIDLYALAGTEVRAMADGIVLTVSSFYCETWVIEIDHGTFIARYGEVDKSRANIFVNRGDRVSRGQKIGLVGRLKGIKVPSNMLHLEMYSTTSRAPLTVRTNRPYERRSDLIDPTPSIDKAVFK